MAPGEDPAGVEPEPDEATLPDKPPIEDMPPAEGDAPPDDEPEVDEAAFMASEEAANDPTIDDAEGEEEPHDPATLDIAEEE
jgi:hypothetical protein